MSDRLSDKCNPHPEAPHGFDRNSSATEDRYVCDCEHWQPPDDLRTRIAKAIAGAVYGHNTLETVWADLHEHAQQEYLAEADAVIRELNLSTVVAPLGVTIITGVLPTWKADDE